MDASLILIPIIISLGLFAMIAIIATSRASVRKEHAKAQAEVQTRLIDKFGSAPDFVAFLSSPAGREFMGNLESQPRLAARERILTGIRSATVLSFLGLAFCLLAVFSEREMIIPGLILLALGGGYIASTVLMVRLSRSWGLLEQARRPDSTPSPHTLDQ